MYQHSPQYNLIRMSNCADEMSPWAAKIMNATALTDNWWEGGNIFSGGMLFTIYKFFRNYRGHLSLIFTRRKVLLIFDIELPILPFLKLLEEKSPPTDPKAYVQYLEQQMLSTAEEAKCSRISSDRKFTLICVTYQELRRLSNLPNSHRYTFRLCFGFIEKVSKKYHVCKLCSKFPVIPGSIQSAYIHDSRRLHC